MDIIKFLDELPQRRHSVTGLMHINDDELVLLKEEIEFLLLIKKIMVRTFKTNMETLEINFRKN